MASGWAPIMARSLTVPLTASSPMSPPGKRMGLTTNESVVKARRVPATSTTAASLSGPPGAAAASAGPMTSRRSAFGELAARAVAQDDPLPSGIGAGQATPSGSIVGPDAPSAATNGSSTLIVETPRRSGRPARSGTTGIGERAAPSPRPAPKNAAHVPSELTIGAPSGFWGEQSVP